MLTTSGFSDFVCVSNLCLLVPPSPHSIVAKLTAQRQRSWVERDLQRGDLSFLTDFAFFRNRRPPSAVVDRLRERGFLAKTAHALPDDPEGLDRYSSSTHNCGTHEPPPFWVVVVNRRGLSSRHQRTTKLASKLLSGGQTGKAPTHITAAILFPLPRLSAYALADKYQRKQAEYCVEVSLAIGR
jgi:hypothetical protein